MRRILLLLALQVPFFSMAGTFYGFMNQDVSYNTCFVGVDAETLEYSGSVSNAFLSETQREQMKSCTEDKKQGLPAVIEVKTFPATQKTPDGLTTHFPTFEVECVQLPERDFGIFLNQWRNEVKNSNFRRCF